MKTPLTNHSAGPWTEIANGEGIRTVEVPDFAAFFEFVNRGFGDTDTRYVWRGQSDSAWDIESSLKRTGKHGAGQLYNFQKAVSRCTNTEFRIDDKNEIATNSKLRLWSLGQHHGLHTPLIDWTIYPFVALFFAFASAGCPAPRSAIYALDWGSIQYINFDIGQKLESFRKELMSPPYEDCFKQRLIERYGSTFGDDLLWMIEKSEIPAEARERLVGWEKTRCEDRKLKIYTPRSNENPRIHSQGGRHIYTPEDMSVEAWIRECSADGEIKSKGVVLTKIAIPNSERTAVLKSLNRMNINYLSLFPDFEGAAKHCNMALEDEFRGGLREY